MDPYISAATLAALPVFAHLSGNAPVCCAPLLSDQ